MTNYPFGVGLSIDDVPQRIPQAAQTLEFSTASVSVINFEPTELFSLNKKMNFPPKRVVYFVHKKHGIIGVWLDVHNYDEKMSELSITGWQWAATKQLTQNIGRKPDEEKSELQASVNDSKEPLITCLYRHTTKQAYTLVDEDVDEKYRWNPAGGCKQKQCNLMAGWHNDTQKAKKSGISNVSLSTIAYSPTTATTSLYVDYTAMMTDEERQEYAAIMANFIKSKFTAAAGTSAKK